MRKREITGWLIVLNAYWFPLAIEDTALLLIVIPAQLIHLAPSNHVAAYAVLASIIALVNVFLPMPIGALSDRLRGQGTQRQGIAIIGAALNVAGLLFAAISHSIGLFYLAIILAQIGQTVSTTAYQAMLPDSVPRSFWGLASGIRGAATLLGSIGGLWLGGFVTPVWVFVTCALLAAIGVVALLGLSERQPDVDEHAHIRDWHDFVVVFLARAFTVFGLTLLTTFVLYFFSDVLHVSNPTRGTGIAGLAALVGAAGSSIVLGILSDRVRAYRKIIVALCGLPMTVAALGYAIAPREEFIFASALLFGIGYGGILSTGWALALDAMPAMRDVARDLGIWGMATHVPAIVAPLLGGALIKYFHETALGYRVLFALAAFSFAAGSALVLAVRGRATVVSELRKTAPFYFQPLRITTYICIEIYHRIAFRVRSWGKLPARRGPTLVVANHQHEIESPVIVSELGLRSLSRYPIFTVSSRRVWEPGFLAERVPWARFLRGVNLGGLVAAIGMQPIENELQTRPLVSVAQTLCKTHGDLSITELFRPTVLERFAPTLRTLRDLLSGAHFATARSYVRMHDLLEPYRSEVMKVTREELEGDIAHFERLQQDGATIFLNPEGFYSGDGKMGRLRGILPRLAPLATIWLTAISYDPYFNPRLTLLYRVLPAIDDMPLDLQLKATRPITPSALLCSWLATHDGPFTKRDAVASVKTALDALASEAFVVPELRTKLEATVAKVLTGMVRLGALIQRGDVYELGSQRTHPNFPRTPDMIAYQFNFHTETLEGLAAMQQRSRDDASR
jgi:MFS family permease